MNSETLLKYAVGGATHVSAASENSAPVWETNRFSLTAVVRTNDPKLTLTGESSTNLTNWSSQGVTSAPDANQTNVPPGCQRRVYSASTTHHPSKLFLRIKALYTP